MSLNNRLKAYRTELMLSQEELARKAGINDKYYGRVERGESSPTIDCFFKICSSLELHPAEIFITETSSKKKPSVISPAIAKCIIRGLQHNIDIHINRNVYFDDCENSVWYNGYVGSMSFDEFELKLYAVGNIRGKLYLDGKLIIQLNGEDISAELRKYISNDKQLIQLIEYMDDNEEILQSKKGNALFLQESNWFSASLVNNQTGEEVYNSIILDCDSIISALSDFTLLFDLVFMNKKAYSEIIVK